MMHLCPTNTNFLGVIIFYWRFMPRAASILAPLTQALQGSPLPRTLVDWEREKVATFKPAKEALQKATNLSFPRERAELADMMDASAAHGGAALEQRADLVPLAAPWEPLGFFSKKLDATQPMTACCWPAFRGSATSASCWKGGGSHSTPTTSFHHFPPWPSFCILAIIFCPGYLLAS